MTKEHHWARRLAYVTGLVNQELLLQNEYLAAENRIRVSEIHLGNSGNGAKHDLLDAGLGCRGHRD
jgi:hypothetical protein